MSSKDLYEESSNTFGICKDSETQTSQIYDLTTTSNTTPTRPLPQNIENKCKDGKVKVFEFCETLQDPCDPDSVTLIKESFSEEVITETPKGSFCGKPTANKYKYCREVIQPLLKSFSTECPSYVIPRGKNINKPVADTEKPDYQPNYEVYSNNKSIEEGINSKSCVSAMSSDDKCKMHCKTTFINPEDSVKKCPSKTDEKKDCINISSSTKYPPVPSCPSKENKCCEKPKSPPCQKCDQIDDAKLKCCVSDCIKKSVKAVKKGSATCIYEIDKLIGIKHGKNCEDKPTYYLLEKPRCPESSGKPCDSSTNVQQQSSMQKFLDSQTQTIATIQCALKDFVGTVCSKTKEAVDVIKTESCKYLNIKSESTTEESKDKKDCSIVKTISSSNSDKIKAQKDKIDRCDSLVRSVEPYVEPAKEVLNKVASIVSSSVSLTKNADFKKIANDIIDAKFNQSSELDQTSMSQRPPRSISQEHEPSSNSNMFTTIKTKLFSIFGQKDNQNNDDDDDELSAERFFDKYCDQ